MLKIQSCSTMSHMQPCSLAKHTKERWERWRESGGERQSEKGRDFLRRLFGSREMWDDIQT